MRGSEGRIEAGRGGCARTCERTCGIAQSVRGKRVRYKSQLRCLQNPSMAVIALSGCLKPWSRCDNHPNVEDACMRTSVVRLLLIVPVCGQSAPSSAHKVTEKTQQCMAEKAPCRVSTHSSCSHRIGKFDASSCLSFSCGPKGRRKPTYILQDASLRQHGNCQNPYHLELMHAHARIKHSATLRGVGPHFATVYRRHTLTAMYLTPCSHLLRHAHIVNDMVYTCGDTAAANPIITLRPPLTPATEGWRPPQY